MAIFVDTGAWFAYFVRRDPDHPAAVEWMCSVDTRTRNGASPIAPIES